MQIKSFFRHYWKSISVVLFILNLSFASPANFKEVPKIENIDKIVHLLLYAGLSIVLIYDFKNHKRVNTYSLAFVLLCLLFPIVLGGMIEILQPQFFSPRTAEWGDWLSDIAGVIVGWLVMFFFKLRIKRV